MSLFHLRRGEITEDCKRLGYHRRTRRVKQLDIQVVG